MKKIYIMDIESDKFEAVNEKAINFRFACVVSESESFVFKSKSDFELFFADLIKKSRKYNEHAIIYAHNLMFDFSFCIELLLGQMLVLRPIENNGKLLSVKAGVIKERTKKNKDGSSEKKQEFETIMEFRDSYSLFQSSLKKLGQFVGLEKIEHDKNWSDEITDSDIEYCLRDCEIVLLALRKFAEFYSKIMNREITIDKLPPTTASAAFKIFKEKTKELNNRGKYTSPWILHDEDFNELFLNEHYFGGRVELFSANFAENVSYCDINSLYPSVMIRYKYHRPPYTILPFSDSHLSDDRTVGFFAVVDERNESVPLLPVRHKTGLYFPASVKKTFVFKEEAQYLMDRRVPMKFFKSLSAAEYPDQPFNYLREFYQMKQRKDSMSYFYKILMNSTYGRFGIDLDKEKVELVTWDDKLAKEVGYQIVELNGTPYLLKKDSQTMKFDRNVVIAAKITAMARLELTRALHTLMKNGIRFYYCDTDSIVCKPNSILRFDESELGAFKLEHEFEWFQGLGNKEYVGKLKGKSEFVVKAKGVHNADLNAIFDYHGETGVEQVNVSKLKTMLNRGWLDCPRNLVMIKKSKTLYHKRILTKDFSVPIMDFNDLARIEQINAVHVKKALESIKSKITGVIE